MYDMHEPVSQSDEEHLLASMWKDVEQIWGKGTSYVFDHVERHVGGIEKKTKLATGCRLQRISRIQGGVSQGRIAL